MSTVAQVTYYLRGDTPLRAGAQPRPSGGATAYVHLGGDTEWTQIQSNDPEALRRLALALLDAADQADNITSQAVTP